MLHDVGEEIEHVYFPHTAMISLVAMMQSGATVETAAIGRAGVIGASAGLGARSTFVRGHRPIARHRGVALRAALFMPRPSKAKPFVAAELAQ